VWAVEDGFESVSLFEAKVVGRDGTTGKYRAAPNGPPERPMFAFYSAYGSGNLGENYELLPGVRFASEIDLSPAFRLNVRGHLAELLDSRQIRTNEGIFDRFEYRDPGRERIERPFREEKCLNRVAGGRESAN
jgi:hypothetical protein